MVTFGWHPNTYTRTLAVNGFVAMIQTVKKIFLQCVLRRWWHRKPKNCKIYVYEKKEIETTNGAKYNKLDVWNKRNDGRRKKNIKTMKKESQQLFAWRLCLITIDVQCVHLAVACCLCCAAFYFISFAALSHNTCTHTHKHFHNSFWWFKRLSFIIIFSLEFVNLPVLLTQLHLEIVSLCSLNIGVIFFIMCVQKHASLDPYNFKVYNTH